MIRLDAICMQHGKQILFIDASAAINRGEKVGLVGPNGAGKSTLFRLITGEEEPDEGNIAIDRGIRIGHFNQDVGEMSGVSAVTETMNGVGPVAEIAAELHEVEQALADPDRADEMEVLLERLGELQTTFEDLDGYELDARAREILAGLGFSQQMMDADVGDLSGGWKVRVALARILLMRPDVLLLDEPSNHLDLESIIWLEGFLSGFKGAILLTAHDREFMNRVVHKIIEIDGGELTSHSGNYDFYEQARATADAQQQAQFDRQQANLKKELAFIERFKARASHASQVQSRVKMLDKIERVEPPKRHKRLVFHFKQPPRSGDIVVELQGVNKAWGDKRVYSNLSHILTRGERCCVLGANGSGKTTLLKLIAGETEADSGLVKVGASVRLGYFAQHAMELLDPEKRVWDTLYDAFPLANVGTLKNLAAGFGFFDEDIEKHCSSLSGGERVRLVLARMLFDPPNFLVLDEPTNHLDVNTKAMLLDALSGYTGTMLFVSHDRHFLTALSNRVLELGPDGVVPYGGGYSEYVASTGREAPGLRETARR